MLRKAGKALSGVFLRGMVVVLPIALTAAILVTLVVGLSRIFLGVHWPTDVLAGWCVGAAWALGCWLVEGLWERRHGRP